jgi:hypothetical protein
MTVLDLALAEAVEALHKAGLPCLLLKGPALAHWLYADPADRIYGDIDLMVDPSCLIDAECVLFELGYRRGYGASHLEVWSRGRRVPVTIELHRTLHWLRCPPSQAWSALSTGAQEMTVARTAIPIMGTPARLLTVALHAAQHGRRAARPLADLDRALALGSLEDWRAAAELARLLDVEEPFGAGLRLLSAGRPLADVLDLPSPSSRELLLLRETPPDTALGFEQLVKAGGWTGTIRFLAHELVPPPEFIRAWQPMARRGRRALVAAYLWRPLWLVWKAPAGYRAWRRALRGEETHSTAEVEPADGAHQASHAGRDLGTWSAPS